MIEEVWQRYREEILRYLTRKLQDPEIARDLAQDVFAQLLEKQQQLSQIRYPDRWIFRIAKNKLIDHKRKRSEVRVEQVERLQSEENPPSDTFIQIISRCIEKLINEYGAGDAELFLSIFSGELSQKEAAVLVDVPYSTMKSRVQKVRSDVLRHFADECCRLIHNSEGQIISCEPLTSAAESCC